MRVAADDLRWSGKVLYLIHPSVVSFQVGRGVCGWIPPSKRLCADVPIAAGVGECRSILPFCHAFHQVPPGSGGLVCVWVLYHHRKPTTKKLTVTVVEFSCCKNEIMMFKIDDLFSLFMLVSKQAWFYCPKGFCIGSLKYFMCVCPFVRCLVSPSVWITFWTLKCPISLSRGPQRDRPRALHAPRIRSTEGSKSDL